MTRQDLPGDLTEASEAVLRAVAPVVHANLERLAGRTRDRLTSELAGYAGLPQRELIGSVTGQFAEK